MPTKKVDLFVIDGKTGKKVPICKVCDVKFTRSCGRQKLCPVCGETARLWYLREYSRFRRGVREDKPVGIEKMQRGTLKAIAKGREWQKIRTDLVEKLKEWE